MTATVAMASRTAWSPRAWAIYLGWIIVTLDASALNLALPTIATQFSAESGDISWVIDAYTLPLASLLLLGGSLGDRVGPERLFRIGALGFSAASLACALSSSLPTLIAFRAAQGVFAALLLPMLLALAGTSFVNSRQRAKVVNLMTLFGGAGMAAGPFLGGMLTDTLGWRAVFWLTVPLAITAVALVGNADGRASKKHRSRFDVRGQIAGSLGLFALVAGIIEISRSANPVTVWTLIISGVLLLTTFVRVEQRAQAPMMPLNVFRNLNYRLSVIGGFAFQFGTYGLQFFLAIHLQTHWNLPAITAGVLLASFAIGTVLISVTVNPVLMRRGTRVMILTGGSIAALATLSLVGAIGREQWWLLVVANFFIGAGAGMYSTSLNQLASGSLGPQSAGLASGIYNTSRQIGQSFGIAILGSLATLSNASLGYTIAILLTAGCATGVALTQLPSRNVKRTPDLA